MSEPEREGEPQPELQLQHEPDAPALRGLRLQGRRSTGLAAAAGVGAAWGVLSYSILWGETSIQLTRRFVDSVPGLLGLLPVRLVLYAIRFFEERLVHHPFDFSHNHAWIGLLSAVVGAGLLVAAFVLVRRAWSVFQRLRTRAGSGQGPGSRSHGVGPRSG
jgi:hypothetical protein